MRDFASEKASYFGLLRVGLKDVYDEICIDGAGHETNCVWIRAFGV
jgi:hypothetical protein